MTRRRSELRHLVQGAEAEPVAGERGRVARLDDLAAEGAREEVARHRGDARSGGGVRDQLAAGERAR